MSLVERRQDGGSRRAYLDPGNGQRMMRSSFGVNTPARSTTALAQWWKKPHAATVRAASASYMRVSWLFGFVEVGRLCAFPARETASMSFAGVLTAQKLSPCSL
jgi:hypothetical protein